jgi:translation initiation factor IF-1
MFSLELEGLQKVLATLAGRLRRNRIKVMNGDRVPVGLSPLIHEVWPKTTFARKSHRNISVAANQSREA